MLKAIIMRLHTLTLMNNRKELINWTCRYVYKMASYINRLTYSSVIFRTYINPYALEIKSQYWSPKEYSQNVSWLQTSDQPLMQLMFHEKIKKSGK